MSDTLAELKILAVATAIGMATIGMVCGLAAITTRQVHHHYSVESCRQFAAQAGYETRFIDLTFWDYQCLAKVGQNWVPTDQLRGIPR